MYVVKQGKKYKFCERYRDPLESVNNFVYF